MGGSRLGSRPTSAHIRRQEKQENRVLRCRGTDGKLWGWEKGRRLCRVGATKRGAVGREKNKIGVAINWGSGEKWHEQGMEGRTPGEVAAILLKLCRDMTPL